MSVEVKEEEQARLADFCKELVADAGGAPAHVFVMSWQAPKLRHFISPHAGLVRSRALVM